MLPSWWHWWHYEQRLELACLLCLTSQDSEAGTSAMFLDFHEYVNIINYLVLGALLQIATSRRSPLPCHCLELSPGA